MAAHRTARRSPTAKVKEKIRSKTAGHCHLCGTRIPKGHGAADHIVSHSRGGESRLNNLLLCCWKCNRLRWHRTAKNMRKVIQLGIYAQDEVRKRTELGKQLTGMFKRRRQMAGERRVKK